MANLSNLKLTLTTDRKLISIESDDFRIKLNGNTNSDYAAMLKPLGVVVTFVSEAQDVVLSKVEPYDDVVDGRTATTQ